MDLLPLRVPPGTDLRAFLDALPHRLGIGGGFVVAGLGSLQDARLRCAGQADAQVVDGPSELLTLSGSLSLDGCHVHLALATADGQVLGGHLGHGSVVRTTVELLLAPTPAHRLTRAHDPSTGFDELVATPITAQAGSPGPHAPPPTPNANVALAAAAATSPERKDHDRMYSAAFIWEPGTYNAEFNALNALIEAAAQSLPGYRGVECWTSEDGRRHNATYYWDRLESLQALATHPQHLEAKRRYAEWYKGYHVVVAQVLRAYVDGAWAHPTQPSLPSDAADPSGPAGPAPIRDR